jgi:hypothetical protein
VFSVVADVIPVLPQKQTDNQTLSGNTYPQTVG